MRAREPASFCRENKIAVVIPLRVLARMSLGNGNNLESVRGFIILRQGDDLSSFTKDNTVNFLVIKKCNEAFRGVYNLRICEKTLRSRSRSRPRI